MMMIMMMMMMSEKMIIQNIGSFVPILTNERNTWLTPSFLSFKEQHKGTPICYTVIAGEPDVVDR